MYKLGLILWSVVYTFMVSGIYMQWHYCEGRLNSVSFAIAAPHDENCCGSNMPQDDDCCHNQHQFLKVYDSHQQGQQYKIAKPFFEFETVFAQPVFSLSTPRTAALLLPVYTPGPPVSSKPALYLQNRVFLI